MNVRKAIGVAAAVAGVALAVRVSGNAHPSGYTYHGCRVYTAGDWFTTNLIEGGSRYVSNTVDPNSANIINNLLAAHGGAITLDVNAHTRAVNNMGEVVNVATTTTPVYTVSTGSFYEVPWDDDGAKTMPWDPSSFKNENGTCTTRGDCHTIVVTGPRGYPRGTHPCMDYETYSHGYTVDGATFTTEYFSVHDLRRPFNDQLQKSGGVTEAQIPLLGTADVGEDASAPSINHIAYMVLPGPVGVAENGYVPPAGAGPVCRSYCAYPIPMGARLRLNPSRYTCPRASTNPQAHKICVQLETYGMIVADQTGPGNLFVIPVGPKSDGTNPWHAEDLDAISSTGGNGIPLTDFDVMTLGPIR
jgi:hypothetical protein